MINLRPLSHYLKTQQLKTVLNLVKKDDWAISIDLKDAYFQVFIHPKHRKYLRFCIQGRAFQLRALAFGPKTSPRVLTKIVAVAAAHLRMQSIRLAVYLDDWLALNAGRRFLLKNMEAILSLLSRLGFLINKEKSNMTPTQDIIYIGGRFCLEKGIVMPTPERIVQLKSTVIALLGEKSVSKAVFTISRPDGFLHSNYTKCKVTNETNKTSPVVLVETGIHRPRIDLSQVTSFKRASELVVIGSQHCQGQIFVSNSSQQNNCHNASNQMWAGSLDHQIIQGFA